MSWTYVSVNESQAPQVEQEILNQVNSQLSDAQRETCKIAASDMKGKDSRGFYIYDNEGHSFGGISDNQFKMETITTRTDYEGLYQSAANYLNSLSMKQAQNARITFTNASAHDATIGIYYPQA